MRVIGQFAAILCACGTLAWHGATLRGDGQAPSTDERAAKVLAAARAALGGEAKLAAIKSFTTTGRTRRVQGDNLVPIEFEILVELPDKYLRKDEVPAQESDPTTIGFNGPNLLQIPAPVAPEPRPGMPAPPPGQFETMLKGRALTARQDFARLMLGLFATSTDAYPLTFKYIGQAEAPQGKAHVLEATGESNFKIKYFVHMESSLPVMVSWTGPARPTAPMRTAPPADAHAAHGPPAAAAPAAAQPPAAQPPAAQPPAPTTSGAAPVGRGTAPSASVPAPSASVPAPSAQASAPSPQSPAPSSPAPTAPENRLYFADYRDVDGIKLPFRLRRGIGTNTTEETTFDRFRLNPKIDPRRFEVRK
jgi:hypothetical protein